MFISSLNAEICLLMLRPLLLLLLPPLLLLPLLLQLQLLLPRLPLLPAVSASIACTDAAVNTPLLPLESTPLHQ